MPINKYYDHQRLSIAMIGTRGLPATDGGIEMAVESLSRELVKRGHRVTVYGRSPYCDSKARLYDGIHQIPVPVVNTKHLEAISHTALAAGHCVIKKQYDVIHFHAVGPSLLSWLPQVRGIPTVATVHACDWRREKWGGVAKAALRAGARVATTVPDKTITVSQVIQEFLSESYGRTPAYVPNGVNFSALANEQPIEGVSDSPFALFLGRIVPEKQVHILIQAFSEVRGDFQLLIAGSSSHTDDYVATVQQLAASDDRVKLLGSRYGAEKAWLLRNATVFVQPSTIEGQPIALLEALACNCPTLVSDIPENLEVVTIDGERHGLTFRMGEASDLAEKLKVALIDNPNPSGTLRIRDFVQNQYNWARIAAETELIYREAVASR